MKPFIGSRSLPDMDYVRPSGLAEALEALHATQGRARLIAGGTDLLPMIRRGAWTVPQGTRVVDIKGLSELQEIMLDGDLLRIGAGVTLTEAADSGLVREHAPILSAAIMDMASWQIRNRGTLGGNLCTASPAADTAPPLLAMDARVRMARAGQDRVLPLKDFFLGPGRTALEPQEILAEILIPVARPGPGWGRMKLGRRSVFTLSVISVAVTARVRDRRFETVRIAFGSVAPTPIRAVGAEKVLEGKEVDGSVMDHAARIASTEISPIDDCRASAAYRRDMAQVLTRRALLGATK
jgi:CO/xanthine dehydrogenase FAD-binding subunit